MEALLKLVPRPRDHPLDLCLTSFDIAICKLVQAESRFSFLVSEQHCWLILSLWSYKILDLSMNSLHS